ncbi:MAG: hypothetical protein ACQESA_02145 [Patescibacteria group bacterium]
MVKNVQFKRLTEDIPIDPKKVYEVNGLDTNCISVKSGMIAFFYCQTTGGDILPTFVKSRKHRKYIIMKPRRSEKIILPFYRNRQKNSGVIIEHQYGEIHFFQGNQLIRIFCFEKECFRLPF